MYYVSADEKEVITNALSRQLAYDDDDFLDVLSSYRCYKSPTKENLLQVLTKLVHQELVQKPRYVGECWRPLLVALKETDGFSVLKSMGEFFQCKKPNAKKSSK